MKKEVFIALFSAIILLSNTAFSSTLGLSGQISYAQEGLRGGKIEVFQDAHRTSLSYADEFGQYHINVPVSDHFHIKFSKAGFTSKIVKFNEVISKSNHKGADQVTDIDIRLFKAYSHLDLSDFNQPIALYWVDQQAMTIYNDPVFNDNIQQRLHGITREISILESVELAASQSALAVARRARMAGNIDKSLTYYHQAMDLDFDQIDAINLEIRGMYNGEDYQPTPNPADQVKEPKSVIQEEVHDLSNKIITKRTVTVNGRHTNYVRIAHQWGGTFYFKGNDPITKLTWQRESSL